MAQAMKNCIDPAPEDSGYILVSGCEIRVLPHTPEKVDWFIKLVDELGRYD